MNNFLEYLPSTKCAIFWDKMNALKNYSDGELAWASFESPVRCLRLPHFGAHNNNVPNWHPTAKPVALYKWILQNYAKPGDTIFDSHLGSASSRIAAYDLGFDFVGCELDKDYFAAQEERFSSHIKQIRLFEPEAVAEQAGLFEGSDG
jgi:site-specific DNA-methyltransferase (adenine-specific)